MTGWGNVTPTEERRILVAERNRAVAEAAALKLRVTILEAERDDALRQRDLAVAHDRQPYPTAWAYERACDVMHEAKERAELAEAKVRAVERLHCWTNEDGKRFVFADDLAVALGITTAAPRD